MNCGEDGGAEGALASCPSIHGRVSQARDLLLQSYDRPQPRLDPHLLPLDGLGVPKKKPLVSYCMAREMTPTTINRATDLATFFASFERVIGPGGLRKSLVGI